MHRPRRGLREAPRLRLPAASASPAPIRFSQREHDDMTMTDDDIETSQQGETK
jgi:hypothetical protein